MPQDVIDRVNTLEWRSNATSDLSFAWRNGTPIADLDDDGDADDSSYLPSDGDDNSEYSDNDFSDGTSQDGDAAAGVDDENNNNNSEPNNKGEASENEGEAPENAEMAEEPAHKMAEEAAYKNNQDAMAEEAAHENNEDALEAMNITQHEDEAPIINDNNVSSDDEEDDSSKSAGVADNSSDGAGVDNNSTENTGVGGDQPSRKCRSGTQQDCRSASTRSMTMTRRASTQKLIGSTVLETSKTDSAHISHATTATCMQILNTRHLRSIT
jgi:hypothetical protein